MHTYTHLQGGETSVILAWRPNLRIHMFQRISRVLVLEEREMRSFWSSTRAVFSHAGGEKKSLLLLFVWGAPANKQQRRDFSSLFFFFSKVGYVTQVSTFTGGFTNARLQLYSPTQNTACFFHFFHLYWFLIVRKGLVKVDRSIGGTDTYCNVFSLCLRIVQATSRCCDEEAIP